MNMDAVLYLKELQRLETTDSKLYSQELMMTDKTFEERVGVCRTVEQGASPQDTDAGLLGEVS